MQLVPDVDPGQDSGDAAGPHRLSAGGPYPQVQRCHLHDGPPSGCGHAGASVHPARHPGTPGVAYLTTWAEGVSSMPDHWGVDDDPEQPDDSIGQSVEADDPDAYVPPDDGGDDD